MTIANQTDRPAGRRRKSLRDIVEINEQLCDGCGECLPSCAEGALSIENGRVVLKAEALCDGLGACIGRCPKGALTLAKRFTDDFIPLESGQRVLEEEPRDSYGSHGAELDIDLTMARNLAAEVAGPQDRSAARCPVGPKEADLDNLIEALERPAPKSWPSLAGGEETPSGELNAGECDCHTNVPDGFLAVDDRTLVNWPIQLALVPPKSDSFTAEAMVLASDCVAYAGPEFHRIFANRGLPLVIGCPKLDDYDLYVAKLGVILRDNPNISEVLIPIMDVPCCKGMWRLAKEALKRSHRPDVKLSGWIFSPTGRPLESSVNILLR